MVTVVLCDCCEVDTTSRSSLSVRYMIYRSAMTRGGTRKYSKAVNTQWTQSGYRHIQINAISKYVWRKLFDYIKKIIKSVVLHCNLLTYRFFSFYFPSCSLKVGKSSYFRVFGGKHPLLVILRFLFLLECFLTECCTKYKDFWGKFVIHKWIITDC